VALCFIPAALSVCFTKSRDVATQCIKDSGPWKGPRSQLSCLTVEMFVLCLLPGGCKMYGRVERCLKLGGKSRSLVAQCSTLHQKAWA